VISFVCLLAWMAFFDAVSAVADVVSAGFIQHVRCVFLWFAVCVGLYVFAVAVLGDFGLLWLFIVPLVVGVGSWGARALFSLYGVVGVIVVGAHAYMCTCMRLCTSESESELLY